MSLLISASIALSPMPRTKLVLNKDGQMNKSKGEYGEWGRGEERQEWKASALDDCHS